MKAFTFLITITLTIILNSTLFAKEINNKIQIQCIDKQLYLIVPNNNLHLTQEAIVDNTGGYVDIPEERLYLKTDSKVYKLIGNVVQDTNNTNKLQAIIKKEDLKKLQKSQNIVLIQKIDLLENNQGFREKNTTTTTTINIYFDTNLLHKEFKHCK